MTKKFLIVGFGGMGCRHAQSLINMYNNASVFVHEPNDNIFNENLALIGESSNNNIKRVSILNEIKSKINFCVIATSAEPRFEILKELLNYDIENFLVEKVVFQSRVQFQEIKKILKGKKVYVNFVNRYFENYIRIKKEIDAKIFSIDIIGGDFGLGCNALHYFDLFKYFGATEIELDKFSLSKNPIPNRRGKQYKEVLGQISLKSKNGSRLNISSDSSREGGVEIIIKNSKSTHIINEILLKHIQFSKNNISVAPLKIQYTSVLTSLIYKDIIASKCLLPIINDSEDIHNILFESINNKL